MKSNLLSKNLDSLASLPSSSLYSWLVSVHKAEFLPDDRIVLYASSIEFLNHLNFLLDYIDIPKWVILIRTNILKVQKEFSNSEFDTELVDQLAEEETEDVTPVFDSGSMCAHPWVGFHVFPTGHCRVCCDAEDDLAKDDGTLCNVNTDSFEDILQSKSMRELRQAFRRGEKPKTCNNCWRREDRDEDSRRTLSKYKLKNIYGTVNWEDEGSMKYFGGHLGNACNLSCRICSPAFSSVIATELNDFELTKKTRWVKQKTFWDNLPGDIKNFEILGGEPFYLKKNVDMLERVVHRDDSKQFMMAFTTNGTIYPKFLDYVEDLGRLDITVSIDNIGDRFELERNGADWNTVADNLTRLTNKQKQSKNISIFVCVTVSIQNVYYLPELTAWIHSLGLPYYINYFNTNFGKDWLDIRNLTSSARDLVLEKLQSDEFESIREMIKDADSDGVEFVKEMKEIDLRRDQNFYETHSEIAKAMGYYQTV